MATALRKPKQKIKPPRQHAVDHSQETWEMFAKSVKEIHNNNAHQLSYEENYRYAYNLVLYKHGHLLYTGVSDLVAKNLDRLTNEVILPTFPSGRNQDPTHQSQEGERLMKAFRRVWEEHTSSMSKLRDLLKYMDRTYTPTNNLPPIYDAGIAIFVKKVLTKEIQEPLTSVILNQIRIEREGFVINRSAIKGCTDILLQLESPTLYKRLLEPAILSETETFYRAEGKRLIDTCDGPQYLKKVEARLSEEEDRTVHYLSVQSHPAIRQILYSHLLDSCLQTILLMPNSGLDSMIDDDKMDDLSRLYRLFVLVPNGVPSLKRELRSSIETRGAKINGTEVESEDDPQREGRSRGEKTAVASQWVQDILDLQDKFQSIWKSAFKSDKTVEASISEGFTTFINKNQRAAEYISLFIDDHLKKGLKGKTDDEIEAILDKAILVFRFLVDKDVFEKYYKSHLSKRLLYARSVSDDAERGMLAKLKVECGYQFTQKLEGMFNDIRVSADTTEAYRTHVASVQSTCIDLSVTVMTSTFWPMNHSTSTCVLPQELAQAVKLFERFYLSRHSGRKLTWQPGLGNVDIKAAFKTRRHDINLPTFAAVVLLLFQNVDEGDELSYEELKQASGIPEADLQRALQSLACGKMKILKKQPPSREVEACDRFAYNFDFSSPLQKIKIGVISTKVETNEERKETRERIEEERKHQTEACIVRVMKDRKHMTHNDLVAEVSKQLTTRFRPSPPEIKKRIEALIEREYLERCEDKKSYNYVA